MMRAFEFEFGVDMRVHGAGGSDAYTIMVIRRSRGYLNLKNFPLRVA